MIPFRTVSKKLGDLLIERSIINSEQLKLALEEQKKKGGYLSQHLIAMGFASEVDIATCLSNQYNFAYIALKNYTISNEVLDLIPLKWIKIYTLIPLDKVRNIVSVAMADPLNEGVIQMLQQITNCDIQVFISTYSELNEAINKYFGEKLHELKEAYLDAKDIGKITNASQFIYTKKYEGPERRIYVRVVKDLDISFYYHGKTFQAKTKDISYGGIAFFSDIFIPIDTNLVCKIYLSADRSPIDVIVNILRVQVKTGAADVPATEVVPGQSYEVAGVFEFIVAEDREALVSFLKENII